MQFPLLARWNRTQTQADSICERGEAFIAVRPYSGRLRNDTLQLGEDRALAISLIVDLDGHAELYKAGPR